MPENPEVAITVILLGIAISAWVIYRAYLFISEVKLSGID